MTRFLRVGPLHQPRLDFRPVEPARHDIGLGDRDIRQGTDRLAIVHGQPCALAQRSRTQARAREEDRSVETEIAIMIGKPVDHPVPPREPPAPRHGPSHRWQGARPMPQHSLPQLQDRNVGDFARLEARQRRANGVRVEPEPGRRIRNPPSPLRRMPGDRRMSPRPVASSTSKWVPAVSSPPATPARTVPPTGLEIGPNISGAPPSRSFLRAERTWFHHRPCRCADR